AFLPNLVYDRAADIVRRPMRQRLAGGGRDGSIEPLFANMPTVETSCTDAKDQVTAGAVRLGLEDGARGRAPRHYMATAVLGALPREHHCVALNFWPPWSHNFAGALAGQDQ